MGNDDPVVGGSAVPFSVPGLGGVPAPYPSFMCGGVPSAVLKATPQPLYDSEWLVPGQEFKQLKLFYQPAWRQFQFCADNKEAVHSNLQQPCMLDKPKEFELVGFDYVMSDSVDRGDRDAILSGEYTFVFAGNRIYFSLPLLCMRGAAECWKPLLRIKPDEVFGVVINWVKPIRVARPVLFYAKLLGQLWIPL